MSTTNNILKDAFALANESAHPDSAIEWWFFQGYYDDPNDVRIHFMITLFRSNLDAHCNGNDPGFQLFLATLCDNEEHSHCSSTWIDPAVIRKAIERLTTQSLNVDPLLQQAYLEELSEFGPPDSIALKSVPEVFTADTLDVRWNSFQLEQTVDGFRLQFEEPGSGRLLQLELCAGARLQVACASEEIPLGEGMHYRSYPRATVTGRSPKGELLTGQAWIDHQWGGTDWFQDQQAGAWLGWDWFGVNMEDGSDWLIMQRWDAESKKVVAMHATMKSRDDVTLASHSFTLTPLRRWESPRTHIHYPVSWRIDIPELDAVLYFEPLCDDQEIASFGIMRSVWEGAGTITGQVRGHSVSGRARGEFHGYGYVFDYKQFLAQLGERVDQRLEVFLPRDPSNEDVERFVGKPRWKHERAVYREALSKPVWDLMDRSGKRWRPIFGMLLLEALGVPSDSYEELICCSSELVHAGALIIDDIEDKSLLRRGQECIHLRYGLDVALNAGNTLYFLPALVVLEHPHLTLDQKRRLLEIKDRTLIQAHLGQATDIYWSRSQLGGNARQWLSDEPERKILQMYAFKTAAASKAIAEMAAVIAEITPEVRSACVEYAEMLGVAYQIIDDVHNFSRSRDWTKVPGEDLANGKPTYVIVSAFRRLESSLSERLMQILCSVELRSDPIALEEGIQLVIASGALEHCRGVAKEMHTSAWSRVTTHLRHTDSKLMLHVMGMKLTELAYDG